jgi:hypothetical protein
LAKPRETEVLAARGGQNLDDINQSFSVWAMPSAIPPVLVSTLSVAI